MKFSEINKDTFGKKPHNDSETLALESIDLSRVEFDQVNENADYDAGYQAAIDAIRRQLSNNNIEGGDGDYGTGKGNGKGVPKNKPGEGGGETGGHDGLDPIPGTEGEHNGQQGNNSGQGGQGGGSSRDADQSDSQRGNVPAPKPGENRGVVRPEDTAQGGSGSGSGDGENGVSGHAAGELGNTPGTAGGMIDRKTGREIAKAEGYDDKGEGEDAVERDWKDAAQKAAQKMQGNAAGYFKSKIDAIWKTATDWKKILRFVIGQSLSPEDKRSAFANKNRLAALGQIARTDKDLYDNLDMITVFIDSSGSMSDEQLRLVLSEVYTLALQKKPITLIVIQCDTRIQEVKVYTSVRELERDLKQATVKGRGGTELKPCWDLLKDPTSRRKYGMPAHGANELTICVTDGFLDQYPRDRRTMQNLLWVVIDNPSFEVKYKDSHTKLLNINSADVK